MLDLGTLGLVSLRDSMYLDAAKGAYERAGLAILSMGTGVLWACDCALLLPIC